MSAKPKPRASEPARPIASTGKPPTSRKASEPSAPKFYNGPTVSAGADVKNAATQAANNGVVGAKRQTSKAAAAVKRHPYSLISLIGTLPLLLVASLFSNVLCPPPAAPPSTLSRIALSPFGLHQASPHSQLHQTLCRPSYLYRQEVLEPYIFPALEDARAQVSQHPVYLARVRPAVDSASRGYDRVLKPVVDRIGRGGKRFYLYYIQPHLPYVYSRLDFATAPIRRRVSLLHQTYFAPHLSTAQAYAQVAFTKSRDTYKSVKEHRFTEAAGVYASRGYQQAQRSYVWVKPRAIGAAARAERFTREHVSPRAIQTMSWVADQTSKGYAIARVLYRIYVHPHVGPYVTKASVATAPYVAAYNRRLHEPYIRPTIQRYFPELVAEKPKSFFQFIADKLPALAALNIAESKGSVDSFVDAPAKEKTKVLANSASTLSKSASSVASSASAKIAATSFSVPNKRAELAAAREAIESQVNAQGRRGYDAIEKELVSVHREFSNDQLPKFVNHGRASLEREIDHVLAGLEKLYTGSKTLTRDQVKQSSEMTETKVAKLLHQARDTVESKRAALQNRAQPIVQRAKADVRNTLGTSFRALADRMKLAESTPKEWDQYNAVRDDVVAWEQKYDGLLDASTSSQIAALNKDIDNQVTEAHSDFGEIFDGFRARLGILKRAAFDHIEALEASSTPSPSSPSSSSADNGRYSILPIVEAGAALEAAHAIIGKGKAEIVQALGQADTAKSSSGLSASASSLSSQLSASAQFAYDAASSAVHDATRSAMYDVGATPSPEIFEEYAASIANAAKDTASVALTAASSAIHDATRSALSAVGATPSPESIVEYASSLNRVAKSSASVAVDAAASVAHDATRAAVKAIGVSSAPEGVRESAASVIAAASSVVHDASRSAASAVGIVPSPESVQEHAESLSSVVSSSVASAVSVASESASAAAIAASALVHDATRSALRAVGATPSPETPGEYIESAAHVIKDALPTDQAAALAASFQSLVGLLPAETPLASSASSYASALASSGSAARSDLLASGSSLLSSLNVAASASVHSATRAASRALGATPSPESVGEYLEDAKVKMMEARRHAESLVRKHASTLLPEVSASPDVLQGHWHEEAGHRHAEL